MTADIRDLVRKAWIPLALVVVVAGLTTLSGELVARNDRGAVQAGQPPPQPPSAGQGAGGRRSIPTSTAAAPGIPRDWNWWKDEAVRTDLGLDEETVQRIDLIYQRRVSRMRPFADEFVRELQAFNQMTRERVVSDADYEVQASKVEWLRSQLTTSRWLMIYRIYRELEPLQYQRLIEIRDERNERFMRGRGGAPR